MGGEAAARRRAKQPSPFVSKPGGDLERAGPAKLGRSGVLSPEQLRHATPQRVEKWLRRRETDEALLERLTSLCPAPWVGWMWTKPLKETGRTCASNGVQ